MKKLVAGPLGIGRRDNKSFAKSRSPRLTSGQIAGEVIDHIDSILAHGTTLQVQDGEAGSHAIAVKDIPVTATERTELRQYKEILAFFKNTTASDFCLDVLGMQKCLNANGFCAIHGNFPHDAHSDAVLLAKSPPQLMRLNNLNEETRPVPERQQIVGGNKLQWNKLYVFPSYWKFERTLQTLVQNYNAQRCPFSDSDACSANMGVLKDERRNL